MIKKYSFFGGGAVYMLNLGLMRVGIKFGKVYMVQLRGFNAINLERK